MATKGGTKTHWKQLKNPNYLGAYSLPDGKDLIIEIISVSKEFVKGENGKEDECTVAKIKDNKPMILNVTNCKMLERLFETPFIEEWSGRRFTIYAAKVIVKGEPIECLRIRDKKPEQAKVKLTPIHPNWNKAIRALQSGSFTIESLKLKYELDEANQELILDEAMKEDAAV